MASGALVASGEFVVSEEFVASGEFVVLVSALWLRETVRIVNVNTIHDKNLW